MSKCKGCKHWGKVPENDKFITIDARPCNVEATDTRNMEINSFAIVCGHDGPIYCGADFGCVNFEKTLNEPA